MISSSFNFFEAMERRFIETWADLIAAWIGIALGTVAGVLLGFAGPDFLSFSVGVAAGAGFMWADFRYSRSQSLRL